MSCNKIVLLLSLKVAYNICSMTGKQWDTCSLYLRNNNCDISTAPCSTEAGACFTYKLTNLHFSLFYSHPYLFNDQSSLAVYRSIRYHFLLVNYVITLLSPPFPSLSPLISFCFLGAILFCNNGLNKVIKNYWVTPTWRMSNMIMDNTTNLLKNSCGWIHLFSVSK